MGQRAGGPLTPVILFGSGDPLHHGTRTRLLDYAEAHRRLLGSKLDPAQMADIRRWAFRQGFSVGRSDDRLLREIARAVSIGRITLAYRQSATSGATASAGGGGAAADDTAPARDDTRGRATGRRPRPAPAPSRPVPGAPGVPPIPGQIKTWIEFQLRDDISGEPIPGADFRIKLTDGSVIRETTDSLGLIRIDGLDPGSCGICEIERDEALQVTRVA